MGSAAAFVIPGDPLTPGWASAPGAKPVAAADAVSMSRIIALPMWHRDIQPILAQLGSPHARAAWLGGAEVKLQVKVDRQTDVQPNYVVEGRITDTGHRAAGCVGIATGRPWRAGGRARDGNARHGRS